MIVNVKGKPFTVEGRIIVALMRKLGVTRIDMSELDLSDIDGLVIDTYKVEIHDHEKDPHHLIIDKRKRLELKLNEIEQLKQEIIDLTIMCISEYGKYERPTREI